MRLTPWGAAPGAVLVALVLALAGAVSVTAAEPWVDDPFTADVAALAAAARAVPAPDGADVVVLFREVRYTFDEAGRATWRRRWVYRVLTPEGVVSWAVSESRWAPWHQERPAVRARVLDAAGKVHELEPAALAEVGESGAGERRILAAILPGVEAGAVVEEEVVIRDHRPLGEAGVSRQELLPLPAPLLRGRLELETPAALPLRYAVHGLDGVDPAVTVAEGRTRVTFDYGALPAAGPIPTGLPGELARYPQVAFSTGESWSAVAQAYSRAVEAQLAQSDVAALLRQLEARPAASQTERTAELLAAVRARVQPVPRELVSAPPVPAPPHAVLGLGRGDSQDLATLVTALLRAAEVPAFVALLAAGFGQDVDAELPGLGVFDRAVVYVPASEPLWIDPADPWSRAGELPSECQGRLALIASPNTQQLVRTPAAPAADNRTVVHVEVAMAAEGPARIVETSEYRGQPERNQRRLAATLDVPSRRQGYLDYVRAAYRAEALGEVEESAATDLRAPYRLRLVALGAGRGFTAGEEAALAIDPRQLFATLPSELLRSGDGEREADFVFHDPFVSEWHYRVTPPPRMEPDALPEDEVRAVGSGELTRRFRREGGELFADFRFTSGPRRLTAGELRVYRTAVRQLLAGEPLVLTFSRPPSSP